MTISENQSGQVVEVELIPGGTDIEVSNENKLFYIVSKANYILNYRAANLTKAFVIGLRKVIPQEHLNYFFPDEIQLLISGGLNFIDVEDLKLHTNFQGWREEDQPYLDEFWLIVAQFTQDEKEKLLAFSTGTNRPPLLGFKYLEPNFSLAKSATVNTKRYPTSSTCSNLLKLPFFGCTPEGYQMLQETLKEAINSNQGFYNA